MKYGSLILEKKDYVYLKRILNISGYAEDFETQKSLSRLTEELKTAHVVDEHEMPDDIIRFNSHVNVSSEAGWKASLQIVIPADKDYENGKISVLTPMGAALFGYAQSDEVDWDFPNGRQRLKINKVASNSTAEKIEVPI